MTVHSEFSIHACELQAILGIGGENEKDAVCSGSCRSNACAVMLRATDIDARLGRQDARHLFRVCAGESSQIHNLIVTDASRSASPQSRRPVLSVGLKLGFHCQRVLYGPASCRVSVDFASKGGFFTG